MDGYLYAIILFPAMSDLLGTTEPAVIGWYGGIVLSIFMIGWALGGLIFGPSPTVMAGPKLWRSRS
jgi:hypothetical protein